jgi:hypothetical protein
MIRLSTPLSALATLMLSATCAVPVFAQKATPPYKLSVFATAPKGSSAPDSIAVVDGNVFVGYGDGHDPAGADGLNSEVVEYRMDGTIERTYSVPGHSDGLKVDPATHLVWALQNEDASANLVIINPKTHTQKHYTFSSAAHGGGYDDIVFRGCRVYISASNPANNPNAGPAIVSATLEGNTVEVKPVLLGNANAIDIPTDNTVQLNLQDPDSMTLDPEGNIVLDSQADQELIIVSNPGSSAQRVLHLPLSYVAPTGVTPVEVDDTVFATSSEGFILFADKKLNTVFALKKSAFPSGEAYTAADGGPFVGTIDLTTGIITPVVTGLGNPGGMVFVNTSKFDQDDSHREDRDSCHDRDWDSH